MWLSSKLCQEKVGAILHLSYKQPRFIILTIVIDIWAFSWHFLCPSSKQSCKMYSRPVARKERGVRPLPNLPKGPLFATKWAKNGVSWGGLGQKGPLFAIKLAKNGVLWGGLGPKGSHSGVPHPPPPQIESGYGPDVLYQWTSWHQKPTLWNKFLV